MVRDLEGAEVWVVAVKATFDILPGGRTRPAAEQSRVCLAPEYHGEPGQSSLRLDTDLILNKPNTDILVNGHVYAPGGRATPRCDVGFRVGDVSKRLVAIGDRPYLANVFGTSIGEPRPFLKIPLCYERAFGGTAGQQTNVDLRNPVGTGYTDSGADLVGRIAPNFEYPHSRYTVWHQRPAPAGLGPIGRGWQPRIQHAGTYDRKWREQRQPLYPKDLDMRFFQSTPPDQQAVGYLQGGEPVVLKNLTPEGQLSFCLPRIRLGFTTLLEGKKIHHRGTLHTVILEPDHPRVSLVWHTALACQGREHLLEHTTIVEKEVV